MKNALKIKEALYNQCKIFVDNRLLTIQNTISEIQESLTSETKSSAGDKHETGRAMLQIEREKAGNQLAEILKIRENLSKVDALKTSNKVSLGSIIYTTNGNYYIAISAGILEVESKSFFAISPNTPIGQLLFSKTIGDTITFRTNNFTITDII